MSGTDKSRKIRRQLKKDLLKQRNLGGIFDDAEHLLFTHSSRVEETVPHSLLPAHSACPVGLDFDELEQYPKCAMSSPRPVYIAKKHADLIDKCHKRAIDKTAHNSVLQQNAQHCRRLISNPLARKKEKDGIYGKLVYSLAEGLEKCPDPYFNSNFDFYYTGGNLCVTQDDMQHVLHTDEILANRIKIDRFPQSKELSSSVLRPVGTCALVDNTEVYELKSLRSPHNEDNVRPWFAARQRSNITLLAFDAEECCAYQNFEFKSNDTPFVSFAQFSEDPAKFCVSTVEQHLRLYDLNSENITIQKLFKIKSDASDKLNYSGLTTWNCVRPWKENSFLYANRKQICLADLRTQPEDWLSGNVCGFNVKDMLCEMIASVLPSNMEDLFYVATYHKLHCLDIRFMRQGRVHFGGEGTLCSWTHQLEYPPIFIDTYCRNNEEFIALAGPIADDIRICELTRTRNAKFLESSDEEVSLETYSYFAPTLPWQPPTLEEAYEASCLAGKCLQPEIDMKKRIRCCITGLAFYVPPSSRTNSKLEAMLLHCNSNGDVYASNFRERRARETEQRTNEETLQIMEDYSKKISSLTQPHLKYSQIVDLKGLRQVLLCKKLSDLPPEDFPKEEKAKEGETVLWQRKWAGGGWQRSIHGLHCFKDALAQDLLSIWDIDFNENEKPLTLSQIDKKFKKESSHKDLVASWLVKAEEERNPPMISLPIDRNDSLFSNSFLEQTLPTTEDFAMQQQSTQILLAQVDASRLDVYEADFTTITQQPVKKPKLSKAKKKYVKGF